ncbi:MAG TPA: YWFCY domain-containing protein, partial [Puia sp.]|nr:YWFCY domain-containing protein [Puia sp.]
QQTGEDERSLHRILELVRIGSLVILGLHFYYAACPPCALWQAGNPIVDRLLTALADTGLFDSAIRARLIALLLLAVSLLGARGKKDPKYRLENAVSWLFAGLFLYFASILLPGVPLLYCLLCTLGFVFLLYGGTYLTRVVWRHDEPDLFNRLHESFPQEERLLSNPYSINLKGKYLYHGEERECWINLVDVCRSTLILGSPGSGKTWYLIEPMLKQYIEKGFALLVYDFKYDDLSKLVYNYFERYKDRYPVTPAYYNIHFGDLNRSHRCNPLHPATLFDLQDAGEAARTVLLGVQTHGNEGRDNFFFESAVNFVQALIWFLRLYKTGEYCSWPHVIELAQVSYKDLFPVLAAEPQLVALVTPFIDAYKLAPEQLSGQIASATISLARLSSPQVYYIMSGNDFTLDLNNPAAPKLLTIGSNPQKTETYSPMIAAYINTINRLVNRKGQHPLAEIFDEFSTVRVHTINKSIATGRSNKMALTLCMQDASQLRLTYGKEFTDVILNSCGNIISGQTAGDTARLLSERFGKTMQDRESLTTTASDLQITQSHQLENVIPVSRIASLSSGEFVGMVADTPTQLIPIKTFCCRLVNDPAALIAEAASFADLPQVRDVSHEALLAHFELIRAEVARIVQTDLDRIRNAPEFAHLVL